MRRPVKPFVTEYRAPNRRGKDNRAEGIAGNGELRIEEQPRRATHRAAADGRGVGDGSRSLPPRGLFRGADDPETPGSYEAAMRAADALFSPRATRDTARDDGGARPPPAGASDGETATAAANGAVATGVPEPKGRVLRALDELPPVPSEPESAPAPKRRGRKAGSVNKPEHESRTPHSAGPQLDDTSPVSPLPEDDIAAAASVEQPTERKPVAAIGPVRQRDRFPWVRTKLQPGEKWKRRLPKVAW